MTLSPKWLEVLEEKKTSRIDLAIFISVYVLKSDRQNPSDSNVTICQHALGEENVVGDRLMWQIISTLRKENGHPITLDSATGRAVNTMYQCIKRFSPILETEILKKGDSKQSNQLHLPDR